uniref:Uncharacterized protein n=1 Tax=Chromera velia CCMP2878 TaxID=1169474 RepID=A0A0K6SAP7_9ALVE|eukprot:Cvel_11804.t2-p1 / transcript=Cvel_11804.t2 / gene=Cvel_11804 / organism=Chromera_velia_CCMP2878 / gene_product=hypothetical protein / transcript_product=hypothetical protein / location=Cvel_scaffold751:21708-24340(+) / protein_length=318 / sequence_SO=supercontig / SO=protein_coding / is_pseudo=false
MAPPRPDTSQGVLLNSNGPEKQSFALRSRPSSSPPVRSRQRPRTTTSSRPGLKSRAHSAPGHEKRRGKKVDGGPALKAAVDFLDMQTDIGPFLPVPMMRARTARPIAYKRGAEAKKTARVQQEEEGEGGLLTHTLARLGQSVLDTCKPGSFCVTLGGGSTLQPKPLSMLLTERRQRRGSSLRVQDGALPLRPSTADLSKEKKEKERWGNESEAAPPSGHPWSLPSREISSLRWPSAGTSVPDVHFVSAPRVSHPEVVTVPSVPIHMNGGGVPVSTEISKEAQGTRGAKAVPFLWREEAFEKVEEVKQILRQEHSEEIK